MIHPLINQRPLEDRCGVGVDDISGRRDDFGFHAPTLRFRVAGTLANAHPQSASTAEIGPLPRGDDRRPPRDRRGRGGRFRFEESPLRQSPHTVHDLVDAEWTRPYSREEAVCPAGVPRTDTYGCPVGRVDDVDGNRNPVCTCPTPDGYRDEAVSVAEQPAPRALERETR